MSEYEVKSDLCRYLGEARASILWKLEGVSEFDVRRPLVPTGSNLLGIVKHLALVEIGYFGDTFGRPYHGWVPFFDESRPNSDMWASADESRQQIVDYYRAAWAHSDATVDELPLATTGRVPWWPPERSEVTLQHVLARVTAETNRHAGHADILRELVDGKAGWLEGNTNVPDLDPDQWAAYRGELEEVAQRFA